MKLSQCTTSHRQSLVKTVFGNFTPDFYFTAKLPHTLSIHPKQVQKLLDQQNWSLASGKFRKEPRNKIVLLFSLPQNGDHFKWSGLRISVPIQNPDHLKTNIFLTLQNQDASRFHPLCTTHSNQALLRFRNKKTRQPKIFRHSKYV